MNQQGSLRRRLERVESRASQSTMPGIRMYSVTPAREGRRGYRCWGRVAGWSGWTPRRDAGRANWFLRKTRWFRTGWPHEYPDEQGSLPG